MADAPKGSPLQMVWLVLLGLGVLIFFWFYTGAYKHAELKGIYLAPPPPVGPGGGYGPQIGKPNPNYPTNNQDQ
jgi:hypothetical protein